jgi:hypothetical protein
MSKDEYLRGLNGRFGPSGLRKITLDDLRSHLSLVNDDTIYYVGSASPLCNRLLACIDIDDKQHDGDAPNLAQWLIDECPILKNSYVEYSPGGYGIHMYLLLCTSLESHNEVNDLLKRFESYMSELSSHSGYLSVIDGIKGTFPIVEREKNSDLWTCPSMGLLVSLPCPQTLEELEELTNLTPIWCEELEAVVNASHTETGKKLEQESSKRITSCVPRGNSQYPETVKKGQEKTNKIATLLSSGNGSIRRIGALFDLEKKLGRPPSFEEYEQFYYESGLTRNPKKTKETRRRELHKIFDKVIDQFDPSLAIQKGFHPEDYAFVTLTPEQMATFQKKMGKKKITDELVQVVVYLAEHPNTDSPDPIHNFTLGFNLIQSFCRKLYADGTLQCAYTSRIFQSVAKQIAVSNGWIEKIGGYRKGSHCMRYIPGPNHPRRADFMADYGKLVMQITEKGLPHEMLDWPVPQKVG